MADRDDSLIREVNEDLQRERLQKLWEQYNGVILAVAAAIVIGVGGYKWVEQRRYNEAATQGARYATVVRDLTLPAGAPDKATKAAEAERVLASIAKESGGYGTLARLRQAAQDVSAGKSAEALATYEALADDRSIDILFSDYARLQTAMLKVDTSSWTDMKNRLNDLTNEANVWRHSAREVLGLAAMKAGENVAAREAFEKLVADRSTPPSIAERTRILLGLITEAELANAKASVPAAAQPATAPVAPKKN
jgi:hypothetical protein